MTQSGMKSMAEIFRSYGVLDADGRHVGGTDKQTNHRYGDAYETLFPDRGAVKMMMEVGVADGSSLLAWREIFPNAWCVGLDIHPAERVMNCNGISFFLGSQTSHEDCLRAANGQLFDFICEDATHRLEDSLRTLLYLWPFVKPGGLYVIEEFDNVGALAFNVTHMWPTAKIINTAGPFGGTEPLVVFRKPHRGVADQSEAYRQWIDLNKE